MVEITLLGLRVALDDDVYEPSEDSLLLARHVDASHGERVLELGTGTGLAALVAARAGARVVATDVNPVACRLARANAGRNRLALDVVRTDLAAGLVGPFELVLCNPPYLPTSADERVRGVVNRALDGGPRGEQVSARAIAETARVLANDGRALFVVSSLQPLDELEALAAGAGLTWHELEREAYGVEELAVVGLERGPQGERSEP